MHENRVFFTRGVATLQAIFRADKHVRMLLIMFLNSKFICFVELIKFYAFLPKITVIIRNDIEGNVLFYRVVRVIPH